MKIALVSLNQKWEDKVANLKRCRELAGRAKSLGAELVIFPEMTLTGFSMNTTSSEEDAENSPTIKAFSEMASLNQISVFAGAVLKSESKPSNVFITFSAEGKEQTRYAKIHPFRFAKENEYFKSGSRLAKLAMSEFTFGLSICYDLRFPELYSALANDCDVLVNIANWPKLRVDHWRTLLKARAIENQTFVVGVNRIGMDGNALEYEYSSLIVNANGEFLKPLYSETEIDVYEINRQDLIDFRSSFSTRQDRQLNIYRDWI
jgi:omega-amidase